MDPISVGILAINSLRIVLSNPLLGGGSTLRFGEASELLGLLGMLLEEGEDGFEDLKAFAATIQLMAEQGREPTPTEWEILRQRSQDAHDRLQAAKEELLGEEEPEATEPTTTPEAGSPETPTDHTSPATGGNPFVSGAGAADPV